MTKTQLAAARKASARHQSDLRGGIKMLLGLRRFAAGENRRYLDAVLSSALEDLTQVPAEVPDTVPGDFRPTLYAPSYARTELATQLMERT